MPPAPAPPGARLTLTRASRLLSSGRLSSVELCTYCYELAQLGERPLHDNNHNTNVESPLRAADDRPPPGLGLNAFAQLSAKEEFLQHAAEADRRREAGIVLSPLDGIPISIKANIAAEGWTLSAASRILNGHDVGDDTAKACVFDSDVVHRLLKGGGVIIGTTNMDEFGMGSLGNNALPSIRDRKENTKFAGLVKNPLPYLGLLTPSFLLEDKCEQHVHDEDDLDDLWAHHVTSPLLWRHPELLHDVASFDHDQYLSAGGSSSGSAASVALGSSLLSIGTDTGGSVRLPAAWTGVVGLKPTYGLVSRYGVVAYASSLDTVGILAPTANCAGTALDIIVNRRDPSGEDDDERLTGDMDSTSVSIPRHQSVSKVLTSPKSTSTDSQSINETLEGLSVGVPSAFSVSECPPLIRRAWQTGIDRLRAAGANIETIDSQLVSAEMIEASLSAYYVLACAEASSNLSRYDGVEYGCSMPEHYLASDEMGEDADTDTGTFSSLTELEKRYSTLRSFGFGKEVVRRILCGTSVLSSDRFHSHFEAATKVRAVLAQQFQAAFQKGGVDLMLVPTALSLPPHLGPDGSKGPNSTEMFANDVMTIPISLAGLPSVSVPVHLSNSNNNSSDDLQNKKTKKNGIVGLQVFGPKLSEHQVLTAASVLEID